MPDLTFDHRTTLELGETRLDLYASDLSTTDDYMIVPFPAGRLVI